MLRRLSSIAFVALLAACSSNAPKPEALGSVVQAESDTFGVGTGRDGTLTLLGPTVVNRYAAITAAAAAGARTLTVDTTVGFATGGLVVVWQTTGLASGDAPSGTQTTINLAGKAAGRYEFGRIESVTATSITLTNPLLGAYAASGAQVVRVPEYTTLTISSAGSVVAQAWNGTKGGIAAVFVSGTLQNDGAIDASGAGFRGGPLQNGAGNFGCTANDGWTDLGGGAHKGEGLVPSAFSTSIAATTPATVFGRGNVSIAGGGGDCHNAGGGGGGHGGKGGTGGNTWQGDPGAPSAGRAVGGLGGAALDYDFADHLSMGGGGGSGDENDDVGTGGAPGGGVVLVRANTISGAGFYTADGSSVLTSSNNDAAGGGGAGGAVVVRARTSAACSTISAKGGTGGSSLATDHGTGGGGSGGRVLLDAPAGTCPTSVVGGAHGTVAGGASWNGTDGAAGTSTKTTGTVGAPCSAADIAANRCGGCITNLDCPLAGKRTCFLGTHTCVECTLDAECAGANFCDTAAHACTPKLDNGTPVPTIAGHTPALTGDCSVAVGTAVCKSGVCDTTDDDCGYPNGHVCLTSSECRSASCSSITKVCIPAGGCAADADCAAGKYCDTGASLCKDKLANGTPIPTITGHTPPVTGDCTGATGPIVCISNVCETSDDKCGFINGHTCVASDQCRSTVCGAASKVCIPVGGCVTSGDCSGGAVCTGGTCGSGDAGTDVGVDTGSDTGIDTGVVDSSVDTGAGDTGTTDTGTTDTGTADTASSDSSTDAADSAVDSGELDTGSADSGEIDSGEIDSGTTDTGADIDGSLVEDGGDDGGAAPVDEGTLEGGGFSCSAGRSSSSGVGFLSLSLAALLAVTRRRRV